MSLLFTSLTRAAQSMTHHSMVKILCIAFALNALAIGAVVFGLFALLQTVSILPFEWLDRWIDRGIMGFALWLSSFIYPLLLPLIISFFSSTITERIEEREYPHIPTAQPPFWPSVLEDVMFVGKILFINILLLPAYFIPGINIVVYYGVNGYLLGREFFDVVAGRHVSREDGKRWRARYGGSVLLAGALITFASTVPLLNLLSPILGVATMVHLFHSINPPYRRHNIEGMGEVIEG